MVKKRDVEGMGIPEIKYGESMCFVQHVSTGLWVTYAALDAKAARLGTMKRKVRYTLHATCYTLLHSTFYIFNIKISTFIFIPFSFSMSFR